MSLVERSRSPTWWRRIPLGDCFHRYHDALDASLDGLKQNEILHVSLALQDFLWQCSTKGGNGQTQKRTKLRRVLRKVKRRGSPRSRGFIVPWFVACRDFTPAGKNRKWKSLCCVQLWPKGWEYKKGTDNGDQIIGITDTLKRPHFQKSWAIPHWRVKSLFGVPKKTTLSGGIGKTIVPSEYVGLQKKKITILLHVQKQVCNAPFSFNASNFQINFLSSYRNKGIKIWPWSYTKTTQKNFFRAPKKLACRQDQQPSSSL